MTPAERLAYIRQIHPWDDDWDDDMLAVFDLAEQALTLCPLAKAWQEACDSRTYRDVKPTADALIAAVRAARTEGDT